MTRFAEKSFTLPASAGNATICESVRQHCGPDAKGKCLRCGARMNDDLHAVMNAGAEYYRLRQSGLSPEEAMERAFR